MDIQLPPDPRKKTKRMAMYAAGGVALLLVILGLARMKPGAPGVDRSALWIDTVKRGPMVREVRGSGTLVPEDIRWISATSSGTVERIVLRPGRTLQADEVILELTNPQLEQQLQDAELKLQAAEASLANVKVQLNNDLLTTRASGANIEADYNKAADQIRHRLDTYPRTTDGAFWHATSRQWQLWSDGVYMGLPFLAMASITGHPAMSVPCGVNADGLPLSVQLVARHFNEAALLQVAARLESAFPFVRPAV